MNRRLPVYLLIDCSESMIGGGIEAVRSGVSTMLKKLRCDPHALDTVHLSVITFDAEARGRAYDPAARFPRTDLEHPARHLTRLRAQTSR